MGSSVKRATRRRRERALAPVLVAQLALGDLLQGHGQVVLRARLDERRRRLVERALAEHVVVVVDLARALGGDDHERVARVHVLEQLVDAGMDHGRAMVPAPSSARRTISSTSLTARSSSSFTTTWSKRSSRSSCCRATSTRTPISPVLSV